MAREGHITFAEEADFIDSLNGHMMEGAFLLLVVGDGIRSAVYGLAEQILEDHPISFDLALVELELYEHGDGLIVIPSLLAKTAVIEKQRSGYSATVTLAPVVSRKQFVWSCQEKCSRKTRKTEGQ